MLNARTRTTCFNSKSQTTEILTVHMGVCVVCASVKQVGKLQLHSRFLVKGGAFIVEWNPRIVKDHTASRRGEGQRSQRWLTIHTQPICAWDQQCGESLGGLGGIWRCENKIKLPENAQISEVRRKDVKREKGGKTSSAPNNIGWWRENKRRLAWARNKNATCAWQEIWNSRGHGLCPLKDPETSYQKPTQGLGQISPNNCTTITLFYQRSWAKTVNLFQGETKSSRTNNIICFPCLDRSYRQFG